MPRGKKAEVQPVVEKKPIKKSTTTAVDGNIKKENDELKKQLAEVQKLLLELKSGQSDRVKNKKEVPSYTALEDSDVDINPKKQIKVMSLYHGTLCLSTEKHGNGTPYQFDHFGEVKSIAYEDIIGIINNYQKFAKNGFFYILDKQVVANHYLNEFYKNILPKEAMENILDFDRDDMTDIFESASQDQRMVIISLIARKISDGIDVDLTKFGMLTKIYGKSLDNILQDIEIEKEIIQKPE